MLSGRVEGKTILEVGSFNVNGSVRDVAIPLRPAAFRGVDIRPQEGFVDEVLDASSLLERFGPDTWDIVISAEMLEHAEDWPNAIRNMRGVLKPGGLLILTARGPGFPIHAYPNDHWRFTTDDVAAMFQDFTTLYLSDDPQDPGFLYAGLKGGGGSLVANPSPVVVVPHTKEWHDSRIAERMSTPNPPAPLACFYHVACMGNWREVVCEQMTTLTAAGIIPQAYVLGTEDEARWVESQGADIIGQDPRLDRYEIPTLTAAWEWAKANPAGSVLYLHTKGVSAPEDENKPAWRKLMMSALVEPIEANHALLARYDMVGVDWQNSPDYPHFSGNFWLSRADWVASLDSPEAYQESKTIELCEQPWERICAEMWLGSRPWHSIKSLVCSDRNLWKGPDVFAILQGHLESATNDKIAAALCLQVTGREQSVFWFGCKFPWWSKDAPISKFRGAALESATLEISKLLIPNFEGRLVDSYETVLSMPGEVVVLCGILEQCCNGAAEQILSNVSKSRDWRKLILTTTNLPDGNRGRGQVRRGISRPYDAEHTIELRNLDLGRMTRVETGAGETEFLIFARPERS